LRRLVGVRGEQQQVAAADDRDVGDHAGVGELRHRRARAGQVGLLQVDGDDVEHRVERATEGGGEGAARPLGATEVGELEVLLGEEQVGQRASGEDGVRGAVELEVQLVLLAHAPQAALQVGEVGHLEVEGDGVQRVVDREPALAEVEAVGVQGRVHGDARQRHRVEGQVVHVSGWVEVAGVAGAVGGRAGDGAGRDHTDEGRGEPGGSGRGQGGDA